MKRAPQMDVAFKVITKKFILILKLYKLYLFQKIKKINFINSILVHFFFLSLV